MARETVVKVEDLSISYATRSGDMKAVRDVSFEIKRGEALGLVGESGCGKTTAGLAVMGYLAPNARLESGWVLFRGENILEKTDRELLSIRGNRMAMIYQDPMMTLNPSIKIGDQLAEVLVEHESLTKRKAYGRCVEMLNKVKMPDPERVMTRYSHQLSGGQQQRVVIAMALLCNPALVIMDEPTTALDVTVEAAVLDLIRDLRQDFDTAVLFITHNLAVVARVCDRVAVMYAGEMVEKAMVEQLFLKPLHPYTKALLGCVPRVGVTRKAKSSLRSIPGCVPSYALPAGCVFEPRCAYAKESCREVHPALVSVEDGRFVRCTNWQALGEQDTAASADIGTVSKVSAAQAEAEPMLEVSDLKSFYIEAPSWIGRLKGMREQYVRAVDGVSLDVKTGSVLGIVGESGCGKSTLAKTIVGLISPTEGKIEFLGLDVSKIVEKRPKGILKELRMVFQNPDSTLNPTQTVRQIIGRPLRISNVVPRSKIEEEVRKWLDAVNLDESYLDRRPRHMSGGEKQRVAIARAFVSRPELVLCDEPVSSLDVSVQSSVLNVLLDIQASHGASLLYISHDLSMIYYLCDRVIVMYLGKVCEVGSCQDIFAPPYHPYTEALLSAIPVADPTVKQTSIRLEGPVPSALNPPAGCRFHTRCPRKVGEICETTEPPAQSPCEGHVIYCHIPLEELRKVGPVIVGGGSESD